MEGMEDEDIKKETQNLAYPPAFKLEVALFAKKHSQARRPIQTEPSKLSSTKPMQAKPKNKPIQDKPLTVCFKVALDLVLFKQG